MRSPVGVIIELPEMYKLIDRASVGLEIADEASCPARPSGVLGSRSPDRASQPPPFCRHTTCRFSVRTAPWCFPFIGASSVEYLPSPKFLPDIPRLPDDAGQSADRCAASDPCTNLPHRTTSAEPNARTLMPDEIQTTDLFEMIRTTRSMRRLKPDPVPNE